MNIAHERCGGLDVHQKMGSGLPVEATYVKPWLRPLTVRPAPKVPICPFNTVISRHGVVVGEHWLPSPIPCSPLFTMFSRAVSRIADWVVTILMNVTEPLWNNNLSDVYINSATTSPFNRRPPPDAYFQRNPTKVGHSSLTFHQPL